MSNPPASPPLSTALLGEFIGTLVLVLFGTGAVHVAIFAGGLSGLWQVAVVWAFAIALAIYAIGALSGAHINPAVTLAVAVWSGFPWSRVAPYWMAQLAGAVVAALMLYALFGGAIAHFERSAGIVRGEAGSERSAMAFGEYFPNPAIQQAQQWDDEVVTHWQAMLGEGLGTAMLVLFVFVLTDPRSGSAPSARAAPVLIGLGVAIIIVVVAPITQAGLNPARDFGPRLVAWSMGWDSIAIPGPRGGFFSVYILSPLVGGVIGGLIAKGIGKAGQVRISPPPAVSPARWG